MTKNCQHHDHEVDDRALGYDPTGTTGIRNRFERSAVKRFRTVRALINQVVAGNDVFGLSGTRDRMPLLLADQSKLSGRMVPTPRQFEFKRNRDKVIEFMQWLRQAEREEILEIIEGTSLSQAAEQSWMNTYIDSAYKKGLRDASGRIRKAGISGPGPSFFEGAFNRPVHADAVGLIYTRTYSQLSGITEAMDQQISRVLATGLAEGVGHKTLARRLTNTVDNVGIVRARMLARTETVAAHAEASLNMFEEAGVEGVTAQVEFSTAGDDSVCPKCASLNGTIYSLEQARGVIPVHPNCRCAWLPVVE